MNTETMNYEHFLLLRTVAETGANIWLAREAVHSVMLMDEYDGLDLYGIHRTWDEWMEMGAEGARPDA